MSNAAWDQVNFLGGEWSPFAQGRIDLPTYRTALTTCSNAYPIEEGAWMRRSGSCHGAFTNRGKISRLFAYRFADTQPTYQAEISFDGSNTWLRFFYAGELLTEITNYTISSWTANTPAKFNTSAVTAWNTNDDVIFYSPQTNNSNNGSILLGRVFTLTKITTQQFTIADAVSGATFASSAVNFDGTVTNKVARVVKLALPYTLASDLNNVRVVLPPASAASNSGAALLILCNGYPPQVVTASASPARPGFSTLGIAQAVFVDGPYSGASLGPNGSSVAALGSVTASGASGSITFTVTGGNLANGNNGWTSSDINNPIRIYSEPAAWSNATAYSAGSVVTTGTYPNSKFWSAQVANTNVDPTANPTVWVPYAKQQGFWTYGHITAITSTSIVTLSIDGPAIYNSSNIVTWLESMYSSYYGYPVAGVYSKGRLYLASDAAGRFDASYSNVPFNFAPSQYDGTVTDACAISYQLPSVGAKVFTWLLPDPKGILISTQYGESLLSSGSGPDSPITPTSIKFDPFSEFGAYPCDPVRGGGTVLFLQRSQGQIMEYLPDTFSGKFTGRVLNVNAQHLSTTFKRLEFQRTPTPIVWATDGTGLYGCTYRRIGTFVSEDPKFFGWHRHTLATGTVYDISQGTTSFDTVDNLYLATYDGSKYHVEYLDTAFTPSRGANTAHFLDGSPGPGWTFGTATTVRQLAGYDPQLASGSSGIQFFGMAHLVGKSVTVFVNGLNCGTQTVAADGSVTIAYASDPEGKLTKAYMIAQSGAVGFGLDTQIDINNSGQTRVVLPVSIGLPFLSEGQTCRPNDQQGAHLADGPGLGELRRVVRYGMLLQTTGAFNVGANSTNTFPSQLCATDDQTLLGASTMFTGVTWGVIDDNYTYDGRLYWSINTPYPMTVMATASFLHTSERGVETKEQ